MMETERKCEPQTAYNTRMDSSSPTLAGTYLSITVIPKLGDKEDEPYGTSCETSYGFYLSFTFLFLLLMVRKMTEKPPT